MSTNAPSRRGFLRGLVLLPLIGGGLTLVGQPTAAATPVTLPMMTRYVAWLAREYAAALVDLERFKHPDDPNYAEWRAEWTRALPLFWSPKDAVADANVLGARPSTRAAVVLSAVGCGWQGGDR